MSSKITKEIEATYAFMAKVYFGNWQYRFARTPHMKNSFKNNKKESILAHQLACIGFWFNLKRICPNLNKLVDSTKIYEILWGHDLGEVFAGDVSQALQVLGKGKNKSQTERQEIIKMTDKIQKKILKTLLDNFDAFEKKCEEIESIEILVCKLIDNIQGEHFAVVFGNDLEKHSDLINKILNRSFVRSAKRLLEVLKNRGKKKAYQEVKSIVNHHIKMFQRAGVKLKLDKI